jgi:mRNA interferase RelE/StbE
VYRIRLDNQAIKDLDRLDADIHLRVEQAIGSLRTEPRPCGCKKLQGGGGYRIRVGHYRILYEVDDEARQ